MNLFLPKLKLELAIPIDINDIDEDLKKEIGKDKTQLLPRMELLTHTIAHLLFLNFISI